MNSLSWFLYLAGIAGNVQVVLGLFFCVLLFVAGGLFVAGMTTSERGILKNVEPNYRGENGKLYDAADIKASVDKAVRTFRNWIIGSVFTLLLAFTCAAGCTATPDKETFYVIAASEMGEEVLKTPEMGKARQALNKWLDGQISGLNVDASK